MRALFVAVALSGAIIGQTAFAQTDSTAVPSASAQTPAPTTTATAAPSQAATAAAATAPASVSQQSEAASGANLNEIVCKSEPPATGTRLGGGRECHTVREWNDRERQAQDITRRQQVEGAALSGP